MTQAQTSIPLAPGLHEPKVTSKLLKNDGPFPNNEQLPLLIYQGAFDLVRDDPASQIETVFESNVWGGIWRSGIHTSHHYHSNAHEVLGCYAGDAKIQFGGPNGFMVNIKAGDVVIVPAGVAHRNVSCSANFRVVGAYPRGQQSYDLRRGMPNERPHVDRNIAAVPLPDSDPVYGAFGPMVTEWKLISKPRPGTGVRPPPQAQTALVMPASSQGNPATSFTGARTAPAPKSSSPQAAKAASIPEPAKSKPSYSKAGEPNGTPLPAQKSKPDRKQQRA